MYKFLFVALTAFLLAGCDALKTIYVDIEAETVVEDGGVLGGTFNVLGFDDFINFDVSTSAEFENNDATKDNIGASYVTAFVLEVVSPDGGTLSFIDEFEVFIGDGDTETRVAFLDPEQDTDVEQLTLIVYDDRNIGQYLRSDVTEVTVDASGTFPDEDTTIKATIQFEIQLQL